MAKLYPPNVLGTTPAFYGNTIKVPYSMNRSVGYSQIKGFSLKVKTISGKEIHSVQSGVYYENLDEVVFTLDSSYLNVGQHYKFQLAYIGLDDTIGYYSTVTVAKYTTKPNVKIEGMNIGGVNFHNYNYVGVYEQEGDQTEKMYSSWFYFYDKNKQIIHSSGVILHNTNNDNTEEYRYPRDLEEGSTYYIQYVVRTINNLEVSSPMYRLTQRTTISPEIEVALKAELNYDNGYVTITMEADENEIISGSFLLSRYSELYGWEELKRFNLGSVQPKSWSLRDYMIEQGTEYIYSLQQYNSSGIYSDRILSAPIYADFEDAFLYDGNRQLKIRFNPKVSTYKSTILEAKTDTMGSKYTFISRNGNVNYKEFNISGLISYKMDEEQIFMSHKDIGLTEETFNLVSENIAAERRFKNFVNDWLCNGEPKFFRTPAEGNYVVRLMNVSLSPIDTVGRMLHSFNCSAYEISEPSIEGFASYNSIEEFVAQMQWRSVDLSKLEEENGTLVKINQFPAYSIDFSDVTPGTSVYVDGELIKIGITGKYHAETETPFQEVKVLVVPNLQGNFTFSYQSKDNSVFELISKISAEDKPCVQFVGREYAAMPCVKGQDTSITYNEKNIFDHLQDSKTKITQMIGMRFYTRAVSPLYLKDGEYYLNYSDSSPVSDIPSDTLYRIYSYENGEYQATNRYYYGKEISEEGLFDINLDGEIISIKDSQQITMPEMYGGSYLEIGEGVIAELSYTAEKIDYGFETSDAEVARLKKIYENSIENYKNNPTLQNKKNMTNNYCQFLIKLNTKIKEYQEDR